eukprot:CAMPEP_0170971156 /NCGR_PEP_ID=MMETSP0735-20130129/45055_1 /TAXON_ID=186038 /ORGANISM="Fragilariopsis kerguelensis, Strain L26-C5" /LENGTH=902 /DNA_ID=CAMNT_0011391061 /DNA_START=87 /DNA_END=2795 /DNA_ORIENTATION=-
MIWVILTLVGGFFSVANGDVQFDIFTRAHVSVDGFVDTEVCYVAMEDSISDNTNGDRKMNQEDYVDFVKAYGPDGFLEDITTFEELPLILQSTFYYIACLCKTDSHSGSFSGESPTVTEQSYLFLVCTQTSTSIDRVIQSTAPSTAPNEVPIISLAPSVFPSPEISAPTAISTLSPTTEQGSDTTNQEDVLVTYGIGIKGGAMFEDYREELIIALDSLAPEVLQEVTRRQLREGLNITASIILLFQPSEPNPSEVARTFQEELSEAIWNGQLQEFLVSSTLFIIDKNRVGSSDNTEDGGSQGRNIAFAVIGSLALVAVVAFFVTRRQGENMDESEELRPVYVDDVALDKGPGRDPPKDDVDSIAKDAGPTKQTILDPVDLDLTKPKDVDDLSIADEMSNLESGDASSSNAGSSGWSSSAGIDSMNTSSADGLDFEKLPIAAIGSTNLPSAKDRTVSTRDEEYMDTSEAPNMPSVTRDDLDSAIEEGDWAAVGATAALLAAASDSQSYSSKSEQYTGTRSRSGSSVSSLDVARAAELDHLVDAGDWEGVVLAAAKYEGDESKESLPSASISGSESRSNADTAGQTADSSIASSRGLKQQEYKAIVEDLVQRVVPEEIQNVDEMMLQFRGREDELVETLRTMQERAVAQKARHSSQRAAKQQAKLTSAAANAPAKKSKSIGSGIISAIPTAKSLGTGEIESGRSRNSHNIEQIEGTNQPVKQSALEEAISAEDWDAVGAAAALLSSSTDTDEINQFADGISTDGSSATGSNNLAEVADELQELIESGDWNGVVRAAGRRSGEKKTESTESRRLRRLKHLQDEQEALAQAEIWSAIAEQSKQEAETTDQGAASAAQWAIDRSLNALVEAELGGLNDHSTIGTDGDSVSRGKREENNEGDESENEV